MAAANVSVALPGVSLPSLTGLPPISAGGGKSDSSLSSAGSLYHASGDGDWVVNFGGSGGGFGGFGSTASAGIGGASAGNGLAALFSSPIAIIAAIGVAWFLLKK
jgi:hypothetical protein